MKPVEWSGLLVDILCKGIAIASLIVVFFLCLPTVYTTIEGVMSAIRIVTLGS